jgi:Holliday junction resolvasome RuvABC endonuclease subunit
MKFIGLDLSLTHAGVAVLQQERAPQLGVFSSDAAGALIRDRHRRLEGQVEKILEFTDPGWMEDGVAIDPDSWVAVEQPAYAQTQGSQHDRSGLWWMTVGAYVLGYEHVIEVGPSVLKKFATGKGNASKAEMMARTAQDFPGVPFRDDNDSDALWLAEMAKAHHDPDLADVPMLAFRIAALKSVAWA